MAGGGRFRRTARQAPVLLPENTEAFDIEKLSRPSFTWAYWWVQNNLIRRTNAIILHLGCLLKARSLAPSITKYGNGEQDEHGRLIVTYKQEQRNETRPDTKFEKKNHAGLDRDKNFRGQLRLDGGYSIPAFVSRKRRLSPKRLPTDFEVTSGERRSCSERHEM